MDAIQLYLSQDGIVIEELFQSLNQELFAPHPRLFAGQKDAGAMEGVNVETDYVFCMLQQRYGMNYVMIV